MRYDTIRRLEIARPERFSDTEVELEGVGMVVKGANAGVGLGSERLCRTFMHDTITFFAQQVEGKHSMAGT